MPTDVRPNLFIVGAQKSGTSALSWWLSQHPQVCMSFPKEPGFLAFGEQGYTCRDGYGKAAPASQYVVTNEQDYNKLFSHATPQQRVIGEASTWYLYVPGTAQRLLTYSHDAKIIILLRNPADRAYSAFCHARSDQLEPCQDFHDALRQESNRHDAEYLLRYREMGMYSAAVNTYQQTFPPSQLCILLYDDLRADPLATWRKICTFLDIDTSFTPLFESRYNRAGQPRHPALHALMRSYRFKRVINGLLPHRIAIHLKQRVDDYNLAAFPVMDRQCRAELQDYYREDIGILSELIDTDLSPWLR